MRATDVWREIFEPIQGCGPRIAAGLIAAIGTVQRFEVSPDAAAMQASYTRGAAAERLGRLDEDAYLVRDPASPPLSRYHLTVRLRDWKRDHVDPEGAAALGEAVRCHQERSRLRRKARQRGIAKLAAFCGVHVLRGGKYQDVPPEKSFPRRRGGALANWNTLARQALYLLGDQFNRRPDSPWGQRLIAAKARLRAIHPEPVVVKKNGPDDKGTKRYTDGHIHKMAIWRTLTRFVSWLFREWRRLERRQQAAAAAPPT